ncbi:ribonuclease H-like domain-containing protein [Tanacetum coccineum]
MDEEKEDRISLLPDCLLLEIISRVKIMDKEKEEERLMSTKEVIKTTTTISKRWQHLWTRLPTLVFIDEDVTDDGAFYFIDVTNNFLFIDETLNQCPTDVNLKKFKLEILDVRQPSQVNSWIHYAITRNVQEIDLRITDTFRYQSCDDELFFNNSCLISMRVSRCAFNPPNGAIRWDKLKCLCIDEGDLDEDSIGKILSGSPCLETLELSYCYLARRIPKSLFVNFGVLERLSCNMETYESFSNDDELFLDVSGPPISMKLSRCVFNPPNGAIRWDKLKFLCIDDLNEDSIGKILSRSPCLETLQLNDCCGFRRINVTSKSVKNLVLSGYGYRHPGADYYIDTLEINAPYISSLTIEGKMYLEKFLLENVSSLVKAHLNYLGSHHFAADLGRHRDDIEEELLQGLLSSLDHVNEIALGDYNCLQALSRLEATGFQFRKGSDRRGIYPRSSYRVFSLIHK